MKAILKYIEETYEGKTHFSPHAFIDGEDKGEIINNPNLISDIPKEEEIEIEFMQVCPDCFDLSEKDDCPCWYQNYKPITVINEVCKCCGHIL